jgi:hypothetical protein
VCRDFPSIGGVYGIAWFVMVGRPTIGALGAKNGDLQRRRSFMREVKGFRTTEWLPATLDLMDLNAAPFSLPCSSFDGRELPDVDLDALCEAIFAHINGAASHVASVSPARE